MRLHRLKLRGTSANESERAEVAFVLLDQRGQLRPGTPRAQEDVLEADLLRIEPARIVEGAGRQVRRPGAASRVKPEFWAPMRF
jgi:hypothetical protein